MQIKKDGHFTLVALSRSHIIHELLHLRPLLILKVPKYTHSHRMQEVETLGILFWAHKCFESTKLHIGN